MYMRSMAGDLTHPRQILTHALSSGQQVSSQSLDWSATDTILSNLNPQFCACMQAVGNVLIVSSDTFIVSNFSYTGMAPSVHWVTAKTASKADLE